MAGLVADRVGVDLGRASRLKNREPNAKAITEQVPV